MVPAYKPGDHVLTFNWGKIKVGDVIVFLPTRRHPDPASDGEGSVSLRFFADAQNDKRAYFIKRIDKFVYNYVYISGDNKREGSKIRPVARERVIGKVVLKY